MSQVKALLDKSIDEWAKAVTEVADEIDQSNSSSTKDNTAREYSAHGKECGKKERAAYMNFLPPDAESQKLSGERKLPI
eukprot:8194030-Karenia_brevis.AAC.1